MLVSLSPVHRYSTCKNYVYIYSYIDLFMNFQDLQQSLAFWWNNDVNSLSLWYQEDIDLPSLALIYFLAALTWHLSIAFWGKPETGKSPNVGMQNAVQGLERDVLLV